MSLAAGCPRCTSPMTQSGDEWSCPDHGVVTPLWRPAEADYDSLAAHLSCCQGVPSLVPWPLSPGWTITDFGCVATPGREAKAGVVACSGLSDLDGIVEVIVVSEEPGVGLGSRCAGIIRTDPGADIGDGPPHAKVRVEGHPIPLWSVTTADADDDFDRSVFAGEALGRWLWIVLRPASAALMLNEEWTLVDLAGLGPELMELPYGGSPPSW